MIECRQQHCTLPGLKACVLAVSSLFPRPMFKMPEITVTRRIPALEMCWDISVRSEFESDNEGTGLIESPLQDNDLNTGLKQTKPHL
jgi:hypothetical protein